MNQLSEMSDACLIIIDKDGTGTNEMKGSLYQVARAVGGAAMTNDDLYGILTSVVLAGAQTDAKHKEIFDDLRSKTDL